MVSKTTLYRRRKLEEQSQHDSILKRREECTNYVESFASYYPNFYKTLESLPHPKGLKNKTAFDYVFWLELHGHIKVITTYLNSLNFI